MKIRRIKVPNGLYHCMSRLVPWGPVLDGQAKSFFVRQMRKLEVFCGVEVITYCAMANHFHVLVRVSWVRPEEVPDSELVRRFRILYPKPGRFQPMSADYLEKKLYTGDKEAKILRSELLSRMHDVSEFMKELKQRFSIWYNHRYESHGTVWSERFKSVLVEGRGTALKTVAAYIDLNPVRAGLVGDPKDYSWSGYGAACGGDRNAQLGLAQVLGNKNTVEGLRRVLADYRVILYGKGTVPSAGKTVCLDPAAAQKVLGCGGELSLNQRLLCRLRVMRDGIVIGTSDYVASVEEIYRRGFGRKRKRFPVPVKGSGNDDMYALRA